MSRWEIREVRPGDEQILDLLAAESGSFEPDDPEKPARRLAPGDASAFLEDPTVHLIVAFADDRPVGFVLAYTLRRRRGDPVELYVHEVGVHVDWRRQGIGTALVTHMLEFGRRTGMRSGFLLTGEWNSGAVAFYDSLGWRADEERNLVYSFRMDPPH